VIPLLFGLMSLHIAERSRLRGGDATAGQAR
jgi:hypothetical protein